MIPQNACVSLCAPSVPAVDSLKPEGKAEITEFFPEVSLAHQAETKI